jgi:putative membrane protein
VREPGFRFYSFSWGHPQPAGHFDRDRWPALLARWLMLAFSVWVASEVVGGIHLEGIVSILVVAAILGLLNLYLRPVLFVLSLPFTIVTLGFFIVIINALLLGITDWLADIFDVDFSVDSIGAAILGAIVISLVNLMLSLFLRPGKV